VRVSDFFKSYSDRTTKNHSALIKLEHALNGLLNTLDDNIFVIETFETIYKTYTKKANQDHVFVWANRLHPVANLDELILELLNIDLINELFTINRAGPTNLNNPLSGFPVYPGHDTPQQNGEPHEQTYTP
jgi:hypothetical protein